ncbi:MAG: Crp/Fnr family transcriptional regulator [Saprospiraceae bacterium]|jgi:CRP-like cAMP-binding protein
MNTDAILQAFNAVCPIDKDAWQDIEQYLIESTIRKGNHCWRAGDICKQVIFVNKGAFRYYYNIGEDDKEVTGQFFFENSFVTDYESFITMKPTTHNFQALEDSEIIVIPRKVVYDMYDRHKCFERFGRLIAEYNFIGLHETHVNLKSVNPQEQYLSLLKERPQVLARVPLNLIASYLGVTPEHISRIRKKIIEGN